MTRIIKKLLPLLILPFFAQSWALKPMLEAELDSVHGQAMFEVLDQMVGDQPGGQDLRQVRLTIGARLEANMNVEELTLGRYWRPEGTNCSGGSGNDKVCYNNIIPATYNDNINWACTAQPCGSVGLNGDNYTYSDLSHGGGNPGSFFAAPGGFQPDGGVDIKLRDVTMGRVNSDGSFEPLVQENPYLEFAFDDSGETQKLVGFRVGFEETHGYQGNIIDVMSGFIRPNITVQANLIGINVGTIKLEASLGGVRTIGWLDPKALNLISTGGVTGLLVTDPDALVNQSGHAQLYPVQSNYLDHTKGFFISLGTRSIQWANVLGFKPELTQPGAWLNMGGDGGLIATTREHYHPNNYLPGHPKNDQYGSHPNYNIGASNMPTWTENY